MPHAKWMQSGFALAFAFAIAGAAYAQSETAAQERAELDREADAALNQLFAEEPSAQQLFNEAAGYAVFTNYKFAAGIVAGGGNGVAIDKQTNERVYMNMGTAGVGLGLGGQKYQLVVLFETQQHFDEFVADQWEATANANAVAGEEGANVSTNFRDGVLIYPLTEAGLMLNADITGTRFWVDDDLNAGMEQQYETGIGEPQSERITNEDVIEHERQYDDSIERP